MNELGTESAASRIAELKQRLSLLPHPEGGYYGRFACAVEIVSSSVRPTQAAMSAIHFLLQRGECSRWHRLRSSEVWTWIEGAPVELWLFDAQGGTSVVCIGAVAAGRSPTVLVPAGTWQSAASQGCYSLLSCVVAPAFEFADLDFLHDVPAALASLRAVRPEWLVRL